MKQMIILFCVLVGALSSCVEDRLCVCSDKNEFDIRAKKSEAEKVCKGFESDGITCVVE